MNARSAATPIASAGEAELVIANLNTIMDRLMETIEEETAHVRAGRLHEAAKLADAKADLGRRYAAESERVMAARELIADCATQRGRRIAQA